MKLITHQLPDNHNLFHFGDRHLGALLSSNKGWRQLVDMMHSKVDGCSNNYGVDGGDAIEAIMVDDPRFSVEELAKRVEKDKDTSLIRPLEQIRVAVEERKAIAPMLIAILEGNHERKLHRFGNLTQELCNRLNSEVKGANIEYGTYTAKLSIVDKHNDLMYKVFETHGHKTINSAADDPLRREANLKLTLKRHLKFKAGDCAIMIKHHAHKLLVAPPEFELYLRDDGKKIQQHYTAGGQNEPFIHPDLRWYGCAGAFLRLYGDGISGYGEIAEYDPVELGFLVTKVRKRKIEAVEPVYLKL